MGINRMSIFLHALASSSGVSVGGVSESVESDSLFKRCSMYVDCLSRSSFAAIGKAAEEELREEGTGEGNPWRKAQTTAGTLITFPGFDTPHVPCKHTAMDEAELPH